MELCSVPSAIAMRPYVPSRGPPQQSCACTPMPVQQFFKLTRILNFCVNFAIGDVVNRTTAGRGVRAEAAGWSGGSEYRAYVISRTTNFGQKLAAYDISTYTHKTMCAPQSSSLKIQILIRITLSKLPELPTSSSSQWCPEVFFHVCHPSR